MFKDSFINPMDFGHTRYQNRPPGRFQERQSQKPNEIIWIFKINQRKILPSRTEATKQGAKHEIINHHIDFILDGLEQELEEMEQGFEKIEYIISRHIEIYTKNVHESKTMLHEAHNLPAKLFKKIAEKERTYYRIVASVLRNYVGPQIQKDTITAVTFTLFGMCNWIYSWYNPRGPVTPQELSNIISNIFSRGVSNVLNDCCEKKFGH